MALSGSFNTTGYQGRYLTFSWTATQDINANTSTISWTLKGAGTASSSWYNSGPFKVVIDGATVYSSSTRIKLYNGTVVASGTKTLTHNSTGKKSFSASAEAAIYSGSVNCKGSGTWSLNDIPRKATVLTAPNFNDEENPKITYSNPLGNNATTLQACIALNSTDIVVAYRDISKTGTSYTFNLTDAERTALRAAVTSGISRAIRFYIKTTFGGTNYYSYLAKTFTIKDGTPTLNPVVEDTDSKTLALTGDRNKVILGFSDFFYSTGAKGRKGATIVSRKVVCGSKTMTKDTGTITNIDSNVITISATDSRGNTTTQTITKTLINYDGNLRCFIEPTAPGTDGIAQLYIQAHYSPVNFGAKTNTLTIQYRMKTDGGDYSNWITPTAAPTFTNTNSARVAQLTESISGLNYQSEYTFQARAVDLLSTSNSEEKTVKAVPLWDWSETDFTTRVPLRVDSGIYANAATEAEIMEGTNDYKKIITYADNGKGTSLGLMIGPGESRGTSDQKYFMMLNASNLYLNADKILTIGGLGSLSGLLRAVQTTYSLDTDTTAGSGWSVDGASAALVGNNLRVYFAATRNTAISGNPTNEKVCTLKIDTEGKIRGALNVGFSSASTGPATTFTTTSSMNSNILTIDITLAATSGNLTQTNAYFVMPVTINTSQYDT